MISYSISMVVKRLLNVLVFSIIYQILQREYEGISFRIVRNIFMYVICQLRIYTQ